MPEKPSQATTLIQIASDLELFHDADLVAYAVLEVGSHEEVWPLRSKPFKSWLAHAFYEAEETGAGNEAMSAALNAIEGQALFVAPEIPVHIRMAEHQDTIIIDLCAEDWSVVHVTADGWDVLNDSPVRFRRAKAMRPLPTPTPGGNIEMLRPFLNLDEDDDWILAIAWLVAALRPRGPYTCLALHGEQGSGKSSAARILRSFVDPNDAPLRSEPREEHDLVIAAKNGWVCGFDNVSHLPRWLSDAVCRLATGSGFGTRKLYENDEEMIFSARRPVILNGIEEVIVRGDLLDRSLILYLPTMPDRQRRKEEDLDEELDAARPAIFGALLDAVAAGLRNVHDVRLGHLPRMADFATWIVASEPSLPWQTGAFLKAYTTNRSSAVALTLDASPLTAPLAIAARHGFYGTATELLALLEKYVDDDDRRQNSWPKAAHVLSGKLRRLAPALRAVGIEIDIGHSGKRSIRIRTVTKTSDRSDQASENGDGRSDASDADSPTPPNGRPLIGDEMFPVYLAEKGSNGHLTEAEFGRLLDLHWLVERVAP